MIITTESLIINTDHLLWCRREKESKWILVFQGTGMSTTNITEEEAKALQAELTKANARPNATVKPPAEPVPPIRPPTRPRNVEKSS